MQIYSAFWILNALKSKAVIAASYGQLLVVQLQIT